MSEEQVKSQLLDNIMAAACRLSLSKKQAVKIVGGEKKLSDLIEQGKITFTQSDGTGPSAKWKFNMADVLKYARCSVDRKFIDSVAAKPFTAQVFLF